MGLRDRFFTPRTAKAILSWRIVIGVGVGVALGVAGLPVVVAIVAGAGAYTGLVAAAMPRARTGPRIDAFALGEPWRQLVHGSQRASARVHETVAAIGAGPIRDRLASISEQIDLALAESWEIARRGNDIDHAVRRLDPTALQSKLKVLRRRADEGPRPDVDAAIASVESQLATTARLKDLSTRTADRLQLTRTRMEELAARAAEVAVGSADTDIYEHDVDNLVVELESLRLAIEETKGA
jgi:hypothetical protein